MIPKTIHYCWFGGNPIPPLNKACIETWKKHLKGYTFKLWNEDNTPMNEYVRYHLDAGNWAFVSDYVRLYALYEEGGIYLDTDFEVLKSFDPLRTRKGFVAYESGPMINNAISGAERGEVFFKACMDYMLKRHSEGKEIETSPVVTTTVYNKGIFSIDVLPSEWFYPYNPYDGKKEVKILMAYMITDHTYAIHHWAKSWHTEKQPKSSICRIVKKIYGRVKLMAGCN